MLQHIKFIEEIFSSELHCTRNGLISVLPIVNQIFAGDYQSIPDFEVKKQVVMSSGLFDLDELDDDARKENLIAIIPLQGLITRTGWWKLSAEDVAWLLSEYYSDDAVTAIVLNMDTNGGTREAGMVIENALNLRNKPVYSYVNVKSYSLGTYISSVCDGTFASHRKAGVGNIGIMTQIIDDSEWLKKYGIKEITIKPPESKFKNKEVEDAIKGNPEMLIKEYLSPLAQDFQNLVRNGYPNLDESVEGILEGKNFFAEDSHGLVQKVLSMEEMVSYALEQSELQNRLSGVFN